MFLTSEVRMQQFQQFRQISQISQMQQISQQFQQSRNEVERYNSIVFSFENSFDITKSTVPELSKVQDINYYHYVDIINRFSNLKYNWDSYNAEEISKTAIERAIEILNHLNNRKQLTSSSTINVFPMRDGGIQFEFDMVYVCAELEINFEGVVTFILFNKKGDILKKEQLFELSKLPFILEDVVSNI